MKHITEMQIVERPDLWNTAEVKIRYVENVEDARNRNPEAVIEEHYLMDLHDAKFLLGKKVS